MRNFTQRGDVLTTPNTTGAAIASGEGVLLGAVFGVAASSFPAGTDDIVINVVGVFTLPKTPSQAWTFGMPVYWDATNKRATSGATGNTKIGVAIKAVGGTAGETTGEVRLSGAF